MVTIVYGHPYAKSFNHAILEAVLAALRERGRKHALLDLYADGFDAAVREAELALYGAGKTCDKLARKYMDILGGTREIVYIFPVWWGVEPAIVKGFHDKVLLKDFAWRYTPEGRLEPLLRIDKVTLLTTSDAPSAVFRAYFEEYLPEHVFAAVGMGNASWHNFENIVRSTPEAREEFLRLAARVVQEAAFTSAASVKTAPCA